MFEFQITSPTQCSNITRKLLFILACILTVCECPFRHGDEHNSKTCTVVYMDDFRAFTLIVFQLPSVMHDTRTKRLIVKNSLVKRNIKSLLRIFVSTFYCDMQAWIRLHYCRLSHSSTSRNRIANTLGICDGGREMACCCDCQEVTLNMSITTLR